MSRLPFLAVVLGCALVAAASYSPRADFAAMERARIRAHLDSVERELRAKDVSALTPLQRAARAGNLDVLHEYWTRGVFPQNTDFPDERVPYFIDRYGTRCAMAHLIERSGHGEFVARVAATRNNARIRELENDPQLIAWLEENGMTLAEAARIQPDYCDSHPCSDPLCGPCPPVPPASTGYKTATGVSVGADVLAVALNSVRTGLSRTVSGGLGFATGMVGVVIGAANFDQSGSRRTLGFVNASAGAASAALGVYRLARKPGPASRLSVSPWLDARGEAGVSARLTF